MKVVLITLGCPKNTVDSEHLAFLITRSGHQLVSRYQAANAAVINTCAFIGDAAQEAVDTILEAAEHKAAGRLKRLLVTGCLVQRYGSELMAEIPEIDAVLGLDHYHRIGGYLDAPDRYRDRTITPYPPSRAVYPAGAEQRLLSTPPATAYLKLSEGCDNRCAYCLIPSIRGALRSRNSAAILDEAAYLAAQGIKELVLVAQDTTAYGHDRGEPGALAVLLRKLARIEGPVWIRLMYAHPRRLTPAIIDIIAREEKLCKYIDLPLQHVDDALLLAMGRHTTANRIESLLETVRERIPAVAIRSTFIIGFPGETDRAFDRLCRFLKNHRLDHAGFFAYSPEEGTAAAGLPGQLPDEVKTERLQEVYRVQEAIARDLNRSRIGTVDTVLVESYLSDLPAWTARSYTQAPEIDGVVYLDSWTGRAGSWLDVRYTNADAVDLVAAPLESGEIPGT